jgi:hypothetical protein
VGYEREWVMSGDDVRGMGHEWMVRWGDVRGMGEWEMT